MEALHTHGYVAFVHEVNHTYRAITVGKPFPADDDINPLWLGNHIGRWEGDAFVVESKGFNGMTWLDAAGTPASEKLHVWERWRLIDGGKRLQVRLTIEDPDVFTRKWETALTFDRRDDLRLKESVCRENGLY
jgi:hypothetical protein